MASVSTQLPESLQRASIQELHLELLRRRRFHNFDGERVVQFLLDHRQLWEAAMMDRIALSHPGSLPTMGLMKLRDFHKDEWNVDTLFILTQCREDACQLVDECQRQNLGGMAKIHDDADEVDNALGGAEPGQTVVSIWWS